ncbi:hypothetical protein [Anaerosphaera aminiphila]|nr:hypothetical protein [Anaerosphaera aminiphila]
MIVLMDKHAIIRLKKEGHSNRKVAGILHIDRKQWLSIGMNIWSKWRD